MDIPRRARQVALNPIEGRCCQERSEYRENAGPRRCLLWSHVTSYALKGSYTVVVPLMSEDFERGLLRNQEEVRDIKLDSLAWLAHEQWRARDSILFVSHIL